MGSKTGNFFRFIFSLQFLKHLGIAVALFLVIIISVMIYLRVFTRHGESVEVPNIKALELSKGVEVLEALDLNHEVIDSVYIADMEPGTIVDQIPKPKEKIKHYRSVYLIINSYQKPKISLPDVRDLSYRNAKATLEAIGIIVDTVQYVPSEFKNLVKDVKFMSKILAPGARIQRDSHVILVVGGGTGDTEKPTPSYRGLNYNDLVVRIEQDSLYVRSISFDEIPENKEDSAQYFVYKQTPIKGAPIRVGTSVNVWLTKNKDLLEEPEKEFEMPFDSMKTKTKPQDIEDFKF